MKIIDPHIHLFNLTQGDYHWLKPNNPPFWPDKYVINKNFSEKDLRLTSNLPSENNTLAGFVHIEAGFDNANPQREIQWLESSITLPFRSVAYLDITLSSQEFLEALTALKAYPSVVGIRYILDENATEKLTSSQVIENLNTLAQHNLHFEAQLSLIQLSAVNALANILEKQNLAYSNTPLTVIINHAGIIEPISSEILNKAWLTSLSSLAKYEHCAIKCSGWEMTNRNYNQQTQIQIINACLTHFGIYRVMLASNFPLVLFSQNYQDYWEALQKIDVWDKDIKQNIFYQNSLRWYKFESV